MFLLNYPPLEHRKHRNKLYFASVKRKQFGLLRKYSWNASCVASEKASTRGWVGTQIFAEAVTLDAV